jgi:ABC-type transport system involved in multi-copper enzyme maturation permease subunit
MVIFFAAHMIQQEIGQNTIFLLLSKNIKRSNIILGKFLGFTCVILFFLAVMGILYIGIGKLYNIPQNYLHLISIM